MPDHVLSRQPACGHCGHEEHVFYACDWCPCGIHNPPGIYPESAGPQV